MLEKRLEKEIVRLEKELVIIEMYDYVVGLYFLIIISVQFIQDLDKQTRCSALGNRWEENESKSNSENAVVSSFKRSKTFAAFREFLL